MEKGPEYCEIRPVVGTCLELMIRDAKPILGFTVKPRDLVLAECGHMTERGTVTVIMTVTFNNHVNHLQQQPWHTQVF